MLCLGGTQQKFTGARNKNTGKMFAVSFYLAFADEGSENTKEPIDLF